jgi:hypothetical protein
MSKSIRIIAIFLLLLALILVSAVPTLADDTGAKYPGIVDTTAENPYDDIDWSFAVNVAADDTVPASILDFENQNSYVMRATNFSFNIPNSNLINGIKVEIERRNDIQDETAVDALVQLTKDGTTRVGNNQADISTAWPPSDRIKTYGGANDLWGTTWNPDDINASTFGVHFAANAHNDPNWIYVDFIRITVYYSPHPMGVGGEVTRVNNLAVLTPWLGLILALSVGGTILVLNRRKVSKFRR